jgi:hypothetical protein
MLLNKCPDLIVSVRKDSNINPPKTFQYLGDFLL